MKKSYLVASLAGLTLIGLSSMPVSMVGATTEVVSDGQVMFKTDVTRTPAKVIILVLWFSILKYLQRKNSILHPLFSLILTPLTILIIRLMIDLT